MSYMLDSIKLSLYAPQQKGGFQDACPLEEAYSHPTVRGTKLQDGTPDELTT